MNDKEILDDILTDLNSEYKNLNNRISFHEGAIAYTKLLNMKVKLARTIFDGVSLKQDPSRKLSLSSRGAIEKLMANLDEQDKAQKETLLIHKGMNQDSKRSLMLLKNAKEKKRKRAKVAFHLLGKS
jgi:hypothetical protein